MMNKQKNSNLTFVQFLLKAQYLAQEETRSDKGYAMMMTSIISIVMLSTLAAYMTMTNLSKSSTNAYVDGTNTFYAAESGLNKRASILYEKFVDNATPTGSTTSIAMSNCFSVTPDVVPSATDDFECRNYKFRYNNNIAAVKDSSGNVVLNERNGNNNSVDYIANTYVKNNTIASTNTAIAPNPDPTTIPSGQTYAGLKALEYRYTVYATAIRPNTVNATANPGFTADEIEAKGKTTPTPAEVLLVNSYNSKKVTADAANAASGAYSSTSNTVLQMDFKSRVVPLFQFAAFYDGDLEINTGSDMTLSGPVHTNKNLYVLPYGSVTLSLGGKVTAAGSIYNRVDSYGYSAGGVTKMLLNGTNCSTAGNCFPNYSPTNKAPLTVSQITAFGGNVKDGVAGATILKSPPPGFLRKRNYFDNTVGDYYAKADMRLEMVPDRRNADSTIIPFNFTSITPDGSGICTTTLPTQAAVSTSAPEVAINRDPANNYIDPDRKNASDLKCHVFTKGQLQSLRY
jgi:Tfp pilus assembly protein PilX